MTQPESFDVLVVGAGPAGSCAARTAALGGARVLLVEKRLQVGLPVQCAEFVPWQLAHQVPIPPRCVAQTIQQMRTVLPDGTVVDKQAAGMVLDRSLWDKHLAVLAHQAGAELRANWTAAEYDGRDVLLRHGPREARIRAQVIVGADGPYSTVAGWVGQSQSEFVHGAEVELVLPDEWTEIYFVPCTAEAMAGFFPRATPPTWGCRQCQMGGRPGRRWSTCSGWVCLTLRWSACWERRAGGGPGSRSVISCWWAMRGLSIHLGGGIAGRAQ